LIDSRIRLYENLGIQGCCSLVSDEPRCSAGFPAILSAEASVMNCSAPMPPRGAYARWMLPRSLFTLSILSALVVITTPFCLGQQSTRVETFELGPNASVKIENFRGSVRVEVWGERAVRVVAEKKEPRGQPLLASDLMLMSAGGDVSIKCNQTGAADRIDLTVYLPPTAHIQVTGGTYPVEVNGALVGAVVQTTSGDIGYRLPPSASARVSMHSTRGVVRAALAINVDDRVGLHTLQGTLGDGSAPVMLDSKSGNITLLPGAGVRYVASMSDGQPGSRDSGFARQPGQSVERAPSADPTAAGHSGPRASSPADDDYDT